jgi:hypothetical protein
LLVLQVLSDRVFPVRGIIFQRVFTDGSNLSHSLLRYPVDKLVLAVHRGTAPSDILNNATSERRQTLQAALPAMKRADVYLAVHRNDNSVYYRRIDCEAFLMLKRSQSVAACAKYSWILAT